MTLAVKPDLFQHPSWSIGAGGKWGPDTSSG